jgi:hypothetical protein
VPPDKETAYRVAHRGTGGGLAGDRRKITVMKEELQSFAEPTGRLRPCVREPAKPSPLSIIPAYAASFLKSNYGDELVRSPRMTGTIAEESMCQEK